MKKLMLFMAFYACFFTYLKAQDLPELGNFNNLFSAEQRLVRAAVDSTLVVVRFDYALKKGNAVFGRLGKPYFGRSYTLAVVANGQLWFDAAARQPWLTDSVFEPYRSMDSIRPHICQIGTRRATDSATAFRNVAHPVVDSLGVSINPKIGYLPVHDSTYSVDWDKNNYDATGWLVLVSAADDSAKVLNYTIFKPKIAFSDENTEGVLTSPLPTVRGRILGGIYFTTHISTGKIAFHAAGILTKNKDKKAILQPFMDKPNKVSRPPLGFDLTPILTEPMAPKTAPLSPPKTNKKKRN